MRYILMNKDTKVLFFIPSNSSNFNIEIMGVYNESLVPRSIKSDEDIRQWLLSRLHIINRNDISSKLAKDISILEDIARQMSFISVTDTYWVQTIDEPKKWSEISPFKNTVDMGVFRKKYVIDVDYFKPVCHRYWERTGDRLYLHKVGADESYVYAEYQAAQFARYLGFDVVDYQITNIDGKMETISPCICSEQIGMYNMFDINRSKDFLELFDFDFGEDSKLSHRKLLNMVLLDFLILNTDRNMANIGVWFNTDTNELQGVAPIFDLNHSFLLKYRNEIRNNRSYETIVKDKCPWLMDIIKYTIGSDRQYIELLLSKASTYTFTGSHSKTANEVLKHQLTLAYSLL